MNDSFTITSRRERVIPRQTDSKQYGEICEVEIEASSEIIDLYWEYIGDFDKWLKMRLKNETR